MPAGNRGPLPFLPSPKHLREGLTTTAAEGIRLPRQLILDAPADQFAQAIDRRIGDRIKHLQALLPPREDVRVHEGLEVTRDVRLGAADLPDQGIDMPLPGKKRMHQPQPHGFGQYRKTAGDQAEGGVGHLAWIFPRHGGGD